MENERELIDRKKVYELACAGCTKHGDTPGECNYDEPCERLIFAFTVAEPVEAVEVIHAHWAHLGGDEWCCSACGEVITTEGSWENPKKKYCHECGAKMDGIDNA